ncbi:MAG: hypothetical protein H6581_31085 [Bacteroidia bacterium]|nr:hypothetical protein [Bacteroidia bacterium]
MRVPDNSLPELIQSLTRRERKNFKKWALAGGQKPDYLVLFDAIQDQLHQQGKYNETEIIQRFPEYKKHSNFSVKKSDLYDSIIRSIREMGLGKNKALSIEIQEIEIILGKQLYEKALTKIGGAKRRAEKEEKFEELIILLRHEKGCRRFKEDESEYLESIHGIQLEIERIEKLRQNLSHFDAIYEKDYYILSNGFRNTGEYDPDILAKLQEYPLLKSEANAISVRAKRLFYILRRALLTAMGKFTELHIVNAALLKLYAENEFLRDQDYEEFIICHSLQARFLILVGRVEDGLEYARKMLEIPLKQVSHQKKILENYFRVILPLSNDRLIPKLSNLEIEPFIQLIEKGGSQPQSVRQIEHYFWLGKHYLSICEFENAKKWFEKITLQNWGKNRLKIQGITRLLILICYAELNKFDLLELHSGPTLRFLKRNEMFYEIGQEMVRFLRKNYENFHSSSLLPFKTTWAQIFPEPYGHFKKYFDFDKMNW